ncbi:PLP-dependent aminotransferase family protein [Rhizorhabdus dicambivorans]|uniref:PLP-dependent aminotransferase family protein n=1 Tax=Rhizorhabdus dicambivorans TaxID=1850238 RepID=A0A2A4FZ81_9SPHN|nr:PLP-dependent aminotransferase family protein [Rhizorhabdus dicambivorans]ATE65941.1 PLP-dependent aminotransferase family protein [Rhizorhabdus dicambivorans]PCE43056.1 PLP-dependent aminotransferase family protein [Rhizorhabdus dicambivorans]
MIWTPILQDDADTVSGRLLAALRRDIEGGVLPPGAKLPPHRDLAHRLGIGIGTVTSVYGEAARQGLLTATVGRGSFVADAPAALRAQDGPIDLARNLPPLASTQRRFAATLAKLGKRHDLAACLDYAPPAGVEAHRRISAGWLRRIGGLAEINADRLIITSGGQQAMMLAVDSLCRPGDTIMTEAATYFGVRSIAQAGGYRTLGLAMDEEGLLPEALERAAAGGARVLYTLPTLQNPTGRIMSAGRRAEIAAIARKYRLWIIEDDLYSAFALGNAPPPLTSYAPERCFYINAASKALAPGLRTGYLLVPDDAAMDRVLRLIRARVYSPPALGPMVACQWIEDGSADEIIAETQAEMIARHRIAAEKLGTAMPRPGDPRCPHLWLPMSELAAERMVARAMRAGVELTPPSAPLIEPSLISGVRLCLGVAADRTQLALALDRVATALDTSGTEPADAVI